MKKILFIALTISVLFSACKKDEETADTRDQFVGTYNSTLTIKVPSLLWDESYAHVYTFAKSSDAGKLKISDDTGGLMTANVSGKNYTYDKFTDSETSGGVTTTIEVTGSGSISGTTITESGVYNVIFGGVTYPGTWSCTHVRK